MVTSEKHAQIDARMAAGTLNHVSDDSSVDPTSVIANAAKVFGSTIGPNVTLGAFAHVYQSTVQGFPKETDNGAGENNDKVAIGEHADIVLSEIGMNSSVGARSTLSHVQAGKNVVIGDGVNIRFPDRKHDDDSQVKTIIGDNSCIADGVYIARGRSVPPNSYVLPYKRQRRFFKGLGLRKPKIAHPSIPGLVLDVVYGDEEPKDDYSKLGQKFNQ